MVALYTYSNLRYTQRPMKSLVQDTDSFTKTRCKCTPAGSVAAFLLLTVLANTFVSRTFRSRQLGTST